MKRNVLFLMIFVLCSTIAWSQIFEVNPEQWHQRYRDNVLGKHYAEPQSNRNLDTLLFFVQNSKFSIRNDEEWYEPDTIVMFNPYWKSRDIITYNEHGFKSMIIHQDMQYGIDTELKTYARSIYTYNADNRILSLTGQVLLGNETWGNYQMYTYTYDYNGNETSFLSQYWNGQSWENEYRIISMYDNRSNLLSIYLQLWEADNWVYFDNHYTYTYDANNNKLSELIRYWNGNQLKNYKLATYTYNENNYNDTIVNQTWNNDENNWENYDLRIYKYDDHGNITNGLRQTWVNNEWINYRGTAYIYNANDKLLSLTLLLWEYDAWINDRQYIYTYDPINNMLSKSELLWDKTNNKWIKWEQFLYTYNEANCLLSSTWQEGSGEKWINTGREVYEYDSSNNKISALGQWWKNNTWEDAYLYEYQYDEYGNCLSGDLWEWKNNAWIDGYAFELEITYNHGQCIIGGEYYCHNISASYIKTPKPVVAIETVEKEECDIVVYPNPTDGKFKVSSSEFSVTGIEVFDVFGRSVKAISPSFGGDWGEALDISHLPSGMYFVRITTEKGMITRKVIKQ